MNYSLVGITPSQCKTLKITGNCTNVPNVNSDLDKCATLIGQPRLTCYENLDKKLTTQVVPWVPWLWATRCTSRARTSRSGSSTSSERTPGVREHRGEVVGPTSIDDLRGARRAPRRLSRSRTNDDALHLTAPRLDDSW